MTTKIFSAGTPVCPEAGRGISAAGEWRQLKPLFPPLKGEACWIWGAAAGGTADSVRTRPPEEMMGIPGMEQEMRCPVMLLVKAGRLNGI